MYEIAFDNVSYEYPNGFRALNNITLNIHLGQFIVIMGPNGAGKSTLCLTMNGIAPQSLGGKFYGALTVKGMDSLTNEVYKLAQQIGLVMQNPEAQLFCTTVEDELAFGPENLCVPVDQIRERIHRVAKATRIEELLDRGPTNLSGGQIQRVVTAAMVTMEPGIMVFDEATSALDPRGATELFHLAKELNQVHKMTVIMTEHKSEQIAEFADLIVTLNKGEIIEVGTPQQVFSQVEKLAEINVAPPQVTRLMHLLGVAAEKLPVTLNDTEKIIRENISTNGKHLLPAPPPCPEDPNSLLTHTDLQPIIEMKDISYTYPGAIEALHDISLSIKKGDFIGIIGENGAGKSTMVKHFVGLLHPTQGQVRIFGKPVTEYTTASLARRIGLVMQNPDHQLFKSSVLEEISVGPARFGLTGKELEERVQESMAETGIVDLADRHPFSLSWGDRQRVALASILALKPEVVIFDEPTTGQDLEGRLVFMELARKLNSHGYTIIVITHDMELITNYTKRCVVMGKGRILMDDSTKEVFNHPEILSSTFIELPQIVHLARRLGDLGIPPNILTITEMADVLKKKGFRL